MERFFLACCRGPGRNVLSCSGLQRHQRGICSVKTFLVAAVAGALLLSNLMVSQLPAAQTTAQQQSDIDVSPPDEDLDPGGNRFRRISQHLEGEVRTVTVEAWSCSQFTALAIDDVLLVNQSTPGLHVFIVNQATASLMGHQTFAQVDQLKPLISTVSPGRVLVLTAVPPYLAGASDAVSAVLRMLGSRRPLDATDAWMPGSPWALISFAKIGRIDEKLIPSGGRLRLRTRIRLVTEDEPICPSWPQGEETNRRRQFCNQVEGFSNVCSCHRPTAITYKHRPAPWLRTDIVPLTVMSSNRPQYMFRTLTSLLSLQSLNLSQTHVVLRGFFEEPRLICDLLQLPYTQRKLVSQSVANLYRLGIADSFHLFPAAEYVILLEDDVDLSPDIIDYFNATLRLMAMDPDIFCVGAWNDQSFTHTSPSPSEIYRTQQVPLKALAIRRSVWQSELNEQWPEGSIDLSTWLSRVMGPRRYCLRPALSRAFVYSQSLRLIGRLRPAYKIAGTGFALDEEGHRNYDNRLQQLIDRSVSLNAQFARQCQAAVQFATSLAAATGNATLPPSLIISARVSSQPAMQTFWARVARCFSLSPALSCLYKGLCQVNFHNFILIVVFRPYCQFRLPTNSTPDIEPGSDLQSGRALKYRTARGRGHKRQLL